MSDYKIVDTHAHLCDPIFDSDRKVVLKKAQANGLAAIVAVSENLSDAHRNLELADRYPFVHAAAGLHPTLLDLKQAQALCTFIRKEHSGIVAIGEVGLDYWAVKDESQKQLQRDIFHIFIDLSLELDYHMIRMLPMLKLLAYDFELQYLFHHIYKFLVNTLLFLEL